MITRLPYDTLNQIKNYLSYKDRVHFLRVCKLFNALKIERFAPLKLKLVKTVIDKKQYRELTYQLYVNPFDPSFVPLPSFLHHNFIQIIIYESPDIYYDIHIYKKFDETKKFDDYLSDYGKDRKDYVISKKNAIWMYYKT
jgi:hypothetical protein